MDTYPHVFFTSPDEWDPSVLDHDPPHLDGLAPSQVPDQPFGDPMFDAMEISMSASLPTSTSSWMHLQKIVGHTQKSLLFSQPISVRVHPKSLTGMLYAHVLHGHPIQHQGHFQCHHQAWDCSTHPGLHQKAL